VIIEKLSPHTGAEVRGVDLREPFDAAALNRAFVAHSVLVVRGQKLTAPQLLAAIQQFGDVLQQHNTTFALPECPLIHYISNRDQYPDGSRYIAGDGYHTDHSNAEAPPKATILCAVRLPDHGGDTQYVNLHEAYASLDAATKARIEERRAIHVYQSRYSARKLIALPDGAKVPDSVAHPLVRTHPESGRKALYLNPIRTEGIVDMDDDDGLPLLDRLLDHAVEERHQYRHKWQPGDVVMWDNRCLVHRATGGYGLPDIRRLHRTTVVGEKCFYRPS
jgi:taurine dioxygenase